jgi:hypothetical protein
MLNNKQVYLNQLFLEYEPQKDQNNHGAGYPIGGRVAVGAANLAE